MTGVSVSTNEAGIVITRTGRLQDPGRCDETVTMVNTSVILICDGLRRS